MCIQVPFLYVRGCKDSIKQNKKYVINSVSVYVFLNYILYTFRSSPPVATYYTGYTYQMFIKSLRYVNSILIDTFPVKHTKYVPQQTKNTEEQSVLYRAHIQH